MKNRDYELGSRIKAAMQAAGYKTAKGFAEKFNIPYLTVAQHLQGRRTPNEEFLKLYSKKFNVTIQWLETGEGNPLSTKNSQQKEKLKTAFKIELDKRKLDIDAGIDVSLLATVLEEIAKIRRKYALTEKKCALIAANLYSQIFKTTQEIELQKNMVLAFLKTYESSLQ